MPSFAIASQLIPSRGRHIKALLFAAFALVALTGVILVLNVVAAVAAPAQRAVKITEAINDTSGLVVRGTITNHFSPSQNAGCSSSSFLLVGMGRAYQGVAQCDSAGITPTAKIGFSVVFPTVAPGTYHLRFERLHDPQYRYEMAPVPIGLKAQMQQSTLRR